MTSHSELWWNSDNFLVLFLDNSQSCCYDSICKYCKWMLFLFSGSENPGDARCSRAGNIDSFLLQNIETGRGYIQNIWTTLPNPPQDLIKYRLRGMLWDEIIFQVCFFCRCRTVENWIEFPVSVLGMQIVNSHYAHLKADLPVSQCLVWMCHILISLSLEIMRNLILGYGWVLPGSVQDLWPSLAWRLS